MKRLGPIPKTVHTALGPVPVRQVRVVVDGDGKEDPELFGFASFVRRDIQILKQLAPIQKHQVLRHEWVHMVLFDAGVLLDPADCEESPNEERVCDVIATALVSEKLAKINSSTSTG